MHAVVLLAKLSKRPTSLVELGGFSNILIPQPLPPEQHALLMQALGDRRSVHVECGRKAAHVCTCLVLLGDSRRLSRRELVLPLAGMSQLRWLLVPARLAQQRAGAGME